MPSSLNYLTEWLQIEYLRFISETEKLWIDLDKTYLRNKIYSLSDDLVLSPISVLSILLLKKAQELGLSEKRLEEIAKQLRNSSASKVCPYMLDFCIVMSLKWEEINLYISEDGARIMPVSEYNAIQDSDNSDIVIINLNNKLEAVFQDVTQANKSVFSLSRKESEILNVLRDTEDIKEVSVKYKNHQGNPIGYDIIKGFGAKDMNELYAMAHSLWYGKIEVPVAGGKYHRGTATKSVRFDK